MKITIVGAGKVGISLIRHLEAEGYDLTIIDKNEQTIEKISNLFDVIAFLGNGAAYPVLKESGIEKCDLLIALTASDETNLLCCLAAHKLGAKNTVARVRNPEYSEQLFAYKEELGLSMSINPERAVAQEIARILRFPSAAKVELFAHGRAELVSYRIPQESPLNGLSLYQLSAKIGVTVLVCAVSRNDEAIIPDGAFTLEAGDEIYITGSPKEITSAFRKTHHLVHSISSVMVSGGGDITYYLAKELENSGMNLKIIEKDLSRAEELSSLLPSTTILHGDATDHELLGEEGIDKTDAFVSLTGLDEGNILSALYARRQNVSKVIAKVNNDHLCSMMKGSELETITSAKMVTTNIILRYVRSLSAQHVGNKLHALYKLVDGKVEVLEFIAEKNMSSLINIPLKDLRLKKNLLIACIVRNRRTIIPDGSECIHPDDIVLIASSYQRLNELEEILREA